MALVDDIIRTAKGEVGYREGFKNGHWNNDQKYSNQVPGMDWSDFQPWCCTFVSWCAWKNNSDLFPRTASCDAAGAWFKKKGRWSEYPAIGAQVFFGSSRDLNHTGIVYAYDATYVYTIEGNTNSTGAREGNGVYLKKHVRRDARVVGYGYPEYPGGIKSADPLWKTGHKGDGKPKPPIKPTPKPSATKVHMDGVDLSHHNVGITLAGLKQAKAAHLLFVFHKCTEGNGFTDTQYLARRKLVDAADLKWGAYHFARPGATASARTQAKFYLSHAQIRAGKDLYPVLDLEDRGGLSEARLGAWVKDFIDECAAQGFPDGIIYTNIDLPSTYGWKLWSARYSDAMHAPRIAEPWDGYDLWQFSNGAYGHPDSVPGIGHVDISTLAWRPTGRLGKIRTKAPHEPPPPPPPPPPPAPTTFVNAQFNSQHTDKANRQMRDVLIASDLVGFNEVESLWQRLILKTSPKFGVYPTLGTPGYVPICWRKSVFELVASRTYKASDGRKGVSPTRNVNEVDLRHKLTGKIITRRNTQVNPHIEVAGRARVYTDHELAKYHGWLDVARGHFNLLRKRMLLDQYPAITGGDFNVDYLAERRLSNASRVPWFPMTALGGIKGVEIHVPRSGTHGKRGIDWTLTKGLKVIRQWKGVRGASDHDPIYTEVDLT